MAPFLAIKSLQKCRSLVVGGGGGHELLNWIIIITARSVFMQVLYSLLELCSGLTIQLQQQPRWFINIIAMLSGYCGGGYNTCLLALGSVSVAPQ